MLGKNLKTPETNLFYGGVGFNIFLKKVIALKHEINVKIK